MTFVHRFHISKRKQKFSSQTNIIKCIHICININNLQNNKKKYNFNPMINPNVYREIAAAKDIFALGCDFNYFAHHREKIKY